MGLKRFLKKNRMLWIAVASIAVSTTIVSIAVQASPSEKVVNSKVESSQKSENTQATKAILKDEAVKISKEYATKLFNIKDIKSNHTKFCDIPTDNVKTSWCVSLTDTNNKNICITVDAITKKIVFACYDSEKYNEGSGQKIKNPKNLSKEDSEKAKEILDKFMNDTEYVDKAKVVSKILYDNQSIVYAKPTAAYIMYNGFQCMYVLNTKGEEEFVYKQREIGSQESVSIEIKLSDSTKYTLCFDTKTSSVISYSPVY